MLSLRVEVSAHGEVKVRIDLGACSIAEREFSAEGFSCM